MRATRPGSGARVQPAIVRYGYAVLVVVVALVAAIALHTFDLEGFLFVIAVPVAVWLGGRGPGILAVLLSAVVLHFVFIAPEDTGAVMSTGAYFVVFSVLAAVVTILSEARHRAERSIIRARDELDVTVRERTAALRDEIAERKRIEAEIRKQAELLDLAHDAVLVRSEDGTISYWNHGAAETYGWMADEAVGRVSHELLRTTFPAPREHIEAIVRAEGRWHGELVHVRRDGATITVASRWSLRHGEPGGAPAVLEINRDVTDRKRAEEALRVAEAELAHVSRVTTLGEVAASIAHEVNQPLAAIMNNANAGLALLPDGHPEVTEVRAALGDILADAERASTIIERVRALARRAPAKKAPLRLEDVMRDVVAITAGESAARRVTVRTEITADLPVVSGDRVQLQQVLLNIVVNGMDAMEGVEDERRLLEIHGRERMHDGRLEVTVSVRDGGVGIDVARMERLFEAFYTTKPHGMGMGLAISRSIIEMHGGRLWAEANDGFGSTFSFSVPAGEGAPP
jgi:two-component system, LuxR family, sensor kinase FixL